MAAAAAAGLSLQHCRAGWIQVETTQLRAQRSTRNILVPRQKQNRSPGRGARKDNKAIVGQMRILYLGATWVHLR